MGREGVSDEMGDGVVEVQLPIFGLAGADV